MKVAVFGAGTMGSGICQVFASKGHTVLMYASSVASAQKHRDKLAGSLQKRVDKGKMEQAAADAILGRIKTGLKDICTDCDLIVEAAFEDMQVKKDTFKELQGIVPKDCIFTSNTSTLK